MQTLTTMALDVQPNTVSIGAFIETASTENNGIRLSSHESIVMNREEAIELAKAILAHPDITFDEVFDDWADQRAQELEDYKFVLDCAQDVSF